MRKEQPGAVLPDIQELIDDALFIFELLDEDETEIKFIHEFLHGKPGELLGYGWDWKKAARLPVDTILENGLPLGRISALIGESDVGKTYIALILALSIATGRPLIPGLKPRGRNTVLIGLGEDSVTGIARRLERIAEAYELESDEIDWVLGGSLRLMCDMPRPPCRHNGREIVPDEEAVKYFEDIMTKAVPPDLIILDPFALWAPVENENSSGQISAILDFLKGFCRRHNVAILFLQHVSKMMGDKLHQSAARGSSAFAASCRFMIGMRRIDQPSLECAPGSYLELQVVKNNDGPRTEPLLMLRNAVGVPIPVEKPKAPNIQAVVVAAVREFPGLTIREFCTRNKGESAREFIFRRLGRTITQKEIERHVMSCITLGTLVEVGNKKRMELALRPPTSEPQNARNAPQDAQDVD